MVLRQRGGYGLLAVGLVAGLASWYPTTRDAMDRLKSGGGLGGTLVDIVSHPAFGVVLICIGLAWIYQSRKRNGGFVDDHNEPPRTSGPSTPVDGSAATTGDGSPATVIKTDNSPKQELKIGDIDIKPSAIAAPVQQVVVNVQQQPQQPSSTGAARQDLGGLMARADALSQWMAQQKADLKMFGKESESEHRKIFCDPGFMGPTEKYSGTAIVLRITNDGAPVLSCRARIFYDDDLSVAHGTWLDASRQYVHIGTHDNKRLIVGFNQGYSNTGAKTVTFEDDREVWSGYRSDYEWARLLKVKPLPPTVKQIRVVLVGSNVPPTELILKVVRHADDRWEKVVRVTP